MKHQNKQMIYFPKFKTTIKYGLVVSIATIAISLLITGINYIMSNLMII